MWKEENYKMTLCDYYTKNGYCKYGDTCKFAHGKHELKVKECWHGLDCKFGKNCKMYHPPIHYEFWDFLEQKSQSKIVDSPPKYNEIDYLPPPAIIFMEDDLIIPPPPQFICDEKPKKKKKLVVKKKKTIKQKLLDIEKQQLGTYDTRKKNYFKDIANKIDDGIDMSSSTRNNRFNNCVLFKTKCCNRNFKFYYGFTQLHNNLSFQPAPYENIKNCCE